MADMMQAAQQWLAGQLITNASRSVTYTRGLTSLTVQAIVGTSVLSVSDGQGNVRVERPDRDYLIEAAAIAALLPPLTGDLVTDNVDGTVYQVLSKQKGEPAWRNSDTFGTLLRIHTKQIEGTIAPPAAPAGVQAV